MIYPVTRTADETGAVSDFDLTDGSLVGLGVGLQGTDVLQRWSYGAEGWFQDGLPWGEASIAYAGFPVRPQINAFHRPTASFENARIQETGVGVGLAAPVTFASNVYSSLGRFALFGEWRETRAEAPSYAREPADSACHAQTDRLVAYRLQQNPRDLIPNSGFVVSTRGTFDLWTDARGVETGAEQGALGIATCISRGSRAGIPASSSARVWCRSGVGRSSGSAPSCRAGPTGRRLPTGTFVRWKADVVQPLWFVDDGSVLLPVYLKALYGYGFASTLSRAENAFAQRVPRQSAVGGGLGIRLRLFSLLDLDLRFGAAYRPTQGDVVAVYR